MLAQKAIGQTDQSKFDRGLITKEDLTSFSKLMSHELYKATLPPGSTSTPVSCACLPSSEAVSPGCADASGVTPDSHSLASCGR